MRTVDAYMDHLRTIDKQSNSKTIDESNQTSGVDFIHTLNDATRAFRVAFRADMLDPNTTIEAIQATMSALFDSDNKLQIHALMTYRYMKPSVSSSWCT